jgi:hypothetical protein
MKKNLLTTVLLIFINFITFSQNAMFDWAKKMGNTVTNTNYCTAYDIATDASGNVYTTGYFSGTVNFNPAGNYTLTAAGANDIFISKLDASGSFVWAIRLGGGQNDVGYSIAVDGGGNIYVTGSFSSSVNFDPNGSFPLTSAGQEDIFIAKYFSSGTFNWAKRIGTTTPDIAYSLALDGSGGVYTTGYFMGTADFNPGGSSFPLSSNSGSADVFISKLDAAGNFVWAKNMGGTSDEVGRGIAVDASLNVYTTGYFLDVADFDPSGSNANLTSEGGTDIFVSKLNSSGNYVWATRMGGIFDDEGASITVDASGNVYSAGRFNGVADFGSINLTSAGGIDVFVTKQDANGGVTWADRMGGTSIDAAYSIAQDASGDIYTTGYFSDVVDFNPGAGTNNLMAAGNYDVFISKLNNSGNYIWAKEIGGTGYEAGQSITVNALGYIHTVGSFGGTANFNPGGTFNLTALGTQDIFIQKMKPCTNTSNTINVNACLSYTLNSQTYTTTGTYSQTLTNYAGCDSILTINLRISNISTSISSQANVSCYGGNNGTASVLATGGILPYTDQWTPAGGSTSTANNLTAGTYTNIVTDSIGCVKTQTVTIIEPNQPLTLNTSFTDASCTNDGAANVIASGGTLPYSYLWSDNSITSSISGLIAGSYSLIVTDNNGCTKTDNIVISNSIPPAAPSICMVTTDDNSINNIIIWDKTPYTNVDSFIVYREVSTSIYSRIGAVAYDSLSEFIDTSRSVGPANGNPNVGSYRYKLQVRDVCGHYSALGPYHNTIYIIYSGSGQFAWSIPYSIEGAANPVSNYILLCDTANVNVWGPVGIVAGNQASVTDPGFSNHSVVANWRVKTSWSISCTPTRATVNTSRSNIKHASMVTGIESITESNSVKIYPNPASDIVTIELDGSMQKVMVRIMNTIGQIVYEENITSATSTINTSGFAKGIYTVVIEGKGVKVFKKLVIN